MERWKILLRTYAVKMAYVSVCVSCETYIVRTRELYEKYTLKWIPLWYKVATLGLMLVWIS